MKKDHYMHVTFVDLSCKENDFDYSFKLLLNIAIIVNYDLQIVNDSLNMWGAYSTRINHLQRENF